METEGIARLLKLTAQLMELHHENPFKVKSVANAAFQLDKTDIALGGKGLAELEAIPGIGKSIAHKIIEIEQSGSLQELDELLRKTPAGVVEMLSIKGIGPKKVAQLWEELQIESPGELLYACKENRLLELKGFGAKTQESVRKAIEFKMASKGFFHYAAVEKTALDLVAELKKKLSTDLVSITGDMRRKAIVVSKLEIVVGSEQQPDQIPVEEPGGIKTAFLYCHPDVFTRRLFETTGSKEHLDELSYAAFASKETAEPVSETVLYAALGMQYIEPELREGRGECLLAKAHRIPRLLETGDLKGALHNHSVWSDGVNTIKEMAEYCRDLGYQYLGMCDHSQSACG